MLHPLYASVSFAPSSRLRFSGGKKEEGANWLKSAFWVVFWGEQKGSENTPEQNLKPQTLKDYHQLMHTKNSQLTRARGQGCYPHDLLGHVLGGGIFTSEGEVFAELMEFIFATPQNWTATDAPRGVSYFTKALILKRFPEYQKAQSPQGKDVRIPDFQDFKQVVTYWENAEEVKASKKLSDSEVQDIYDYGVQLLCHYMDRWDTPPDKNILGLEGYKSGRYVPPKHLDLTI